MKAVQLNCISEQHKKLKEKTTLKFSFFYEDTTFILQNTQLISDWLLSISDNEGKQISHLEYVFCSDEYLLEINRKHLNHDFYTDIITFPLNEDPIEATLYISIDRVKENASDFNQEFDVELNRVMAHGLLHLLGFNDKTESENENMRIKENEVLKMLKV